MNFNNNHNDNLNIEGYLRGELSPMEARGFEQQIAENVDLSMEVQFQKDIIDTLKAERKAQLKARLQNIELPKEMPQSISATSFYANKSVIAASIIAITGVSVALLFFFNTDKKEISTETSNNSKNPTAILTETSKESSDKNSIKKSNENQPSIAKNDNIFTEEKNAAKNLEKTSNKISTNPISENKTDNVSDKKNVENTIIAAETPKIEETKLPATTKETKKINFEYQHFYQYDKTNEALVFITDIGKHKFVKDIDLGGGAKDYLFWNDLFFEINNKQDVNNLKDGLITDEKQISQLQTIFKKK